VAKGTCTKIGGTLEPGKAVQPAQATPPAKAEAKQ